MKSVFDVRRENLRKLIADWGGPTSLSLKLGYSNASYIAQLAGPHPSRDVGEKLARSVEEKLGLPALWLDGPTPEAPKINNDLLAQCIRAVGTTVQEDRARLTPAQHAELVALTYDQGQRTGTLDEAYIRRLLRLIK